MLAETVFVTISQIFIIIIIIIIMQLNIKIYTLHIILYYHYY